MEQGYFPGNCLGGEEPGCRVGAAPGLKQVILHHHQKLLPKTAVESLTGLIPTPPPPAASVSLSAGVDHPVCLAGLPQGRVEVVLCESRLGVFTLGWWGRPCYGSLKLPRRPVPLCSPFPALPRCLLWIQPCSPPPVLAWLPQGQGAGEGAASLDGEGAQCLVS